MSTHNAAANPPVADPDVSPLKGRTHALITYALFVVGLVLPFVTILGVIVAYVQRGDAKGTVYASHYNWLIGAFWWSFALGLLAILFTVTYIGAVIGVPLAIGTWIFYLYKVIKGGLRVLDGRAVS